MNFNITQGDLDIASIKNISDMTEPEVAEVFDNFIDKNGCFYNAKEVTGEYLFGTQSFGKSPRIDRVLIPTVEMRLQGLMCGAIGVELKSGLTKNYGKAISQAMDYGDAVFIVNNIRIHLDHVFVFPMSSLGYEAESVMTQNRVGSAKIQTYNTPYIDFKFGIVSMLKLFRNGDFEDYSAKTDCIGRQRGSR